MKTRMTAAESFLAEIDDFLDRSGMSATAFGKAALGDPCFVGDMRAGRMPGLRLVEKVQQYIAANSSSLNRPHPAGVSP